MEIAAAGREIALRSCGGGADRGGAESENSCCVQSAIGKVQQLAGCGEPGAVSCCDSAERVVAGARRRGQRSVWVGCTVVVCCKNWDGLAPIWGDIRSGRELMCGPRSGLPGVRGPYQLA